MANPPSPEQVAGGPTPAEAPRRSGGVTALLVVLTVLGVVSLVLAFSLMADASRHNRDEVGLFGLGTVLAVVALIGLGGAWATRYWGPWLYLVAVVVDRLVALVVAPGYFLLSVVGVALAVALVVYAERHWAPRRRPSGSR